MALQQAQMLLSMNSLEAVNAGVQQNNTESFAVALCHLAELHAEQVGWWLGLRAPGAVGVLPSPSSAAGEKHWVCLGQVWLDAGGRKGKIPSMEMDWVWSLQSLLNLGSLVASARRIRGQLFLCHNWNKKESLKPKVVELCMFIGAGKA